MRMNLKHSPFRLLPSISQFEPLNTSTVPFGIWHYPLSLRQHNRPNPHTRLYPGIIFRMKTGHGERAPVGRLMLEKPTFHRYPLTGSSHAALVLIYAYRDLDLCLISCPSDKYIWISRE